jgi:two-component system, cell cycle response regulator CpdR
MAEDPICPVCSLPIAPGGGIVFRPEGMVHVACLPAATARPTAKPLSVQETERAGAAARVVRPRILLIDDDPQVRAFVREALDTFGYESHEAGDGVQGLALFAQHCYELLVIDLRMPAMGGWEIVEIVSRRKPTPPIVVMSGVITTTNEDLARKTGVAVLRKPFGLTELKRAIEEGLAGQQRDTPRKPLSKSRGSDSPEADTQREAPAG